MHMEPSGGDNQLLVSHYNNISMGEASHPSFGPMMSLMTAEQDLEAYRKQAQLRTVHDQQGGPAAAASDHIMYYNDPYQATVFQGGDSSHLSAHDQLSYDQLIISSCVEAQAIDMSCAQVGQLKHHHANEDEVQEEGEDVRLHGQPAVAAAGTKISRNWEKSKTVFRGNAAVVSAINCSLNNARRESAAGVNMESSSKELVVTDSTPTDDKRTRERIVLHPDYHNLVIAYINCRKVGAPPDVIRRLEELSGEYGMSPQPLSMVTSKDAAAAAPDPELDHFMKTYCRVLHQYEEELSKPFNEAMAFLQKVELQINEMVSRGDFHTSQTAHDGSSRFTTLQEEKAEEEELLVEEVEEDEVEEEGGSCGEVLDYEMDACMDQQAEDKQLKDQLLRRYRGYISTLKNEFMKKKKKGKLPKDARQRLLDWWHEHYKWPYPSETEKMTLAETTGLDQKQINNWFINQRKRHWKPSDQDMRYVMVNGQDPPMQQSSTRSIDQFPN